MADRRGSTAGDRRGSQAPVDNRNREIDRALKACNPYMTSTPVYYDFKKDSRVYKFVAAVDHTAVHLSVDGSCIRADSTEAKKLDEERKRRLEDLEKAERAEREPEKAEPGQSTKILKNQFNYSERASQTMNNVLRNRVVITDPPPSITLQNTASQWEIYDAYEEERLANERAAAAGRRKGGKEDDKKGREQRVDDSSKVATSAACMHAMKIMERMVNQNENHDIIDDYKYWEDQSDAFKDDGNLLPLWKFHTDLVKKKEVTCISWNSKYTDLFAVGYGSYDFTKATTSAKGYIQCFTLKNAFPTNPGQGGVSPAPEFFFELESGVMCLDFHPTHSSYLACGLYDGSVCVFDLRQRASDDKKEGDKKDGDKKKKMKIKPIFQSTVKNGKHTDPVWEVHWSKNADVLQFFSISSDGRVTSWSLAKNELQYADVMKLTMTDTLDKADDPEMALIGLSGGTCFDFSRETENIFIIGTEEGHIRRCSKAYNSQYLDKYDGHEMMVYAVRWNHYHPKVFLSCSADWTVKLWEQSSTTPLMSFDLASSVGDVVWAPYSSTVFAAVTADGKVHVFDLNKNKNEPLCNQAVVKNAKLTRLCFNPKDPVLLVGDGRGTVLSLKLSPNLRQKVKPEKGQPDDPQAIHQLEVEKLNRLIAITLKDRELLNSHHANGK